MTRGRRAAVAVLLAALLGWALWPAAAPEPASPPVQAEKTLRHPRPRARRVVTRVGGPEVESPGAPEEAPSMAIPVAPGGDVAALGYTTAWHNVTIHVRYPDGRPAQDAVRVESRDCWVWTRAEGPTIRFPTDQSACTVRVGRADGRLFAWSAPVSVDLSDGKDGEGTAIIPREQTGGLGVMFSRDVDGMVVENVLPGSPADQMGLAEGDVIVEVDGLPTDTLTEDEFVSVMTGPVGTSVEFVVIEDLDTGWAERPLALTRARID